MLNFYLPIDTFCIIAAMNITIDFVLSDHIE